MNIKQYEYMSKNLSGLSTAEIISIMNDLGKDGWKVIQCADGLNANGYNTFDKLFLFVREKNEAQLMINE